MRPRSECPVRWRVRDVTATVSALVCTLVLLGAVHTLDVQVPLHAQQVSTPSSSQPRPIRGQTANMPLPQTAPSAFMATAQALTPEQRQISVVDTDRLSVTWAGRRASVTLASTEAGPRPGTESEPHDPPATPATSPDASSPLARFFRRVVPLTPSAFGLAVRMVAEPSVAVGDSIVWATGNWFAARSTDNGGSWIYVNPYDDFPTFTSDQDTIYDAHRRLFVWYRQGGLVPGRLENSFKLSVSTDGAASWCGYTLRPSDVDPSWGTLNFDYPHLALTDRYLYLSSMLTVTGAGFASPRMILLRISLDELAGCAAFRYTYWTTDEGWSWTPIENGATTTMYLGDTLDAGGAGATGTFRLYSQPEESDWLFYVDRAVPSWTFTERTALCQVLGGGNPCARTDQRITSAWRRQRDGRGEIGFLWNVREGGGFPHPYIDAVTFDEGSLMVTGRPMLWDSKCAWQYGAAAPNGDALGISAFYFCPSQPPAHVVGLADAAAQSNWAMFYSRIGQLPTSTLVWGDYIRMRPDGAGFLATGYTIGERGAEPFLVSFGIAAPGQSQDEQPPGDGNPRH